MKLAAALLLCCGLLAGCGGGDAPPPQPQRSLPRSAPSVTVFQTFDAYALFHWAETNYPQIFHGTTWEGEAFVEGYGTFFARRWNATGNYIGLLYGNVYLYGPVSNWQVQLVPSVASFRCSLTPCPSQVSYLDILHTGMVFDATRNKIYAYVPTGDATHPGSFAIIDASTRAVQYTPPVDFMPYRMAMAPDGKYLYAGTATSHEVVRIALPSFTVEGRLELPAIPPWNGQPDYAQKYRAGSIAVSPVDSAVFAVTLVDPSYGMCASGIRAYRNGELKAELMGSLGDVARFDATGGVLASTCSGMYPDTVTRVAYTGSALEVLNSGPGSSGVPRTLDVSAGALITSSGTVFDLPGLESRGALAPLTDLLFDNYARLIQSCIFATANGSLGACISQTEDYPAARALVFYELTRANPLLAIPLDLPVNSASHILRTGAGRFAVSAGHNEQNWMMLDPSHVIFQNTRIYFVDGINIQ